MRVLSNWRIMIRRARGSFLYKGKGLEAYRSASKLDSKPYTILSLLCHTNLLIVSQFANMNNQANTVITTCADIKHQWAEQRHPNFVPARLERQGGMARFDSGVGMVSRAVITHYPHSANSTVGDYPSMKEVSYHQLPQLSGS